MISRANLTLYRKIVSSVLLMASFVFTLQGAFASTPANSKSSSPASPSSPPPATSPDASCLAGGGQCFADVPISNPFFGFINTIYQEDLVTGYACGGPGEPCDAQSRPYYRPGSDVTRQQMAKFIYNSRHFAQISISTSTERFPVLSTSHETNGVGLYGSGNYAGIIGDGLLPDSDGVYATNSSDDPNASGAALVAQSNTAVGARVSSSSGTALSAQSQSYFGVDALSTTGVGLRSTSTSQYGVWGVSTSNDGVHAVSTSGNGLYATSSSGLAGKFQGNVDVTGTCCASAEGTYRIDDPTDPTNKYLYHSAVTSSELLNIYTGNATLDAAGTAWVIMPEWFEPLNENYTYQLTCIGGFANVYISHKIENNRFQIAGGKAGMEISWQVTGTRHDPYATQNPLTPQQEKPASEKGTYLYPITR